MLTQEQADSIANALMLKKASVPMLACPACGANSITVRQRTRLSPFGSLECPACKQRAGLKHGRLLGSLFILFMIAEVVWAVISWPRHGHASSLFATSTIALSSLWIGIARRLPLVEHSRLIGTRASAPKSL